MAIDRQRLSGTAATRMARLLFPLGADVLKSLFSKKSTLEFRVPDGERVYAIGDVHGRLDCLDALLAKIDADDAGRATARTSLILLGDLIDRGPDSAAVVERCMRLAEASERVTLIMGNHEEMLLAAADGDRSSLKLFSAVGGRETLMSYGLCADRYEDAGLSELAAMIDEAIPAAHRRFLAAGRDQVRIGDYLFVHAGIRPGVPLDEQKGSDLRWIREAFLDSKRAHGPMIVHGHTITANVDIRANRIGIDTGAYSSGQLTAIALEGADRWFLHT